MNERIQELYQQAHSIRHYDGDPALDGNPPTVYWQGEVSAQRFAELIVRECADVAQGWSDAYVVEDTAPKQIDVMMRKHFGVEE